MSIIGTIVYRLYMDHTCQSLGQREIQTLVLNRIVLQPPPSSFWIYLGILLVDMVIAGRLVGGPEVQTAYNYETVQQTKGYPESCLTFAVSYQTYS